MRKPYPPGRTNARGYGGHHQRARAAALARLQDGDPCSRCGHPMFRVQKLELDHDDHDRSRYRGLSHARCNRAAGGRKSHWQTRRHVNYTTVPNPSREW